MCIGLHVQYLYSCPIFIKPVFPRQFLEKNVQISNFIKIPPVEAELFHADRRTDTQTDIKKLIVALSNFANSSTNENPIHQFLIISVLL